MLHVQNINSLDLPELAPYRTMRRPTEHREQGIFVAEGEKVVRRLIESHFTITSALLPEKWVPVFEPLLQARSEDIRVFVAETKEILEKLTGFSMYQGVMAVGKIPAPVPLDDILSLSARPRLYVAVDALTNAENLGALVRNCVAFGVQALLVGETSSSPFLRRAVRNSMGTIFQLPVVELAARGTSRWGERPREPKTKWHSVPGSPVVSPHQSADSILARTLQELRRCGIRCIAAHPHTSGKTLSQADLTRDCCIVFGSEGYGISPAILETCDEAVAIPMPPTVDSLNVGAAAAVFLYEANRQRGKM